MIGMAAVRTSVLATRVTGCSPAATGVERTPAARSRSMEGAARRWPMIPAVSTVGTARGSGTRTSVLSGARSNWWFCGKVDRPVQPASPARSARTGGA